MALHDLSSDDLLYTIVKLYDAGIIMQTGDTITFSVDVSYSDEPVSKISEPTMLSAIIIAPSVRWGAIRAKELNYGPSDVMVVPFSRDMQHKFDGRAPDEDGEPVIYLTGLDEIMAGPIDTPDKRMLRNLLKRLEYQNFEIINLDELGMSG